MCFAQGVEGVQRWSRLRARLFFSELKETLLQAGRTPRAMRVTTLWPLGPSTLQAPLSAEERVRLKILAEVDRVRRSTKPAGFDASLHRFFVFKRDTIGLSDYAPRAMTTIEASPDHP